MGRHVEFDNNADAPQPGEFDKAALVGLGVVCSWGENAADHSFVWRTSSGKLAPSFMWMCSTFAKASYVMTALSVAIGHGALPCPPSAPGAGTEGGLR